MLQILNRYSAYFCVDGGSNFNLKILGVWSFFIGFGFPAGEEGWIFLMISLLMARLFNQISHSALWTNACVASGRMLNKAVCHLNAGK